MSVDAMPVKKLRFQDCPGWVFTLDDNKYDRRASARMESDPAYVSRVSVGIDLNQENNPRRRGTGRIHIGYDPKSCPWRVITKAAEVMSGVIMQLIEDEDPTQ